MITEQHHSPIALFDTDKFLLSTESETKSVLNIKHKNDYHHTKNFLAQYASKIGTFTSYRREVERFIHWSWLIKNKSLNQIQLNDLEEYATFCQSPPKSWISHKKSPRFLTYNDLRIPNPQWRPFLQSNTNQSNNYQIKKSSLKETFTILRTFYNYLTKCQYATTNPFLLFSSQLPKVEYTTSKLDKGITKFQWQSILKTINQSISISPDTYQRAHFIFNIIYHLKLKLSELSANNNITPKMSNFKQNSDGKWYFISSENRQVFTNTHTLEALIRWRKYLGLSDLPTDDEQIPLIPSCRGSNGLTTDTHLRRIIKDIYHLTASKLKQNGHLKDAKKIHSATVTMLKYHLP
ncbi:MAG: hypothetical protein EP298_00570 [Gammaproteobacteria bacterium]|nr:MAG: hypothetical protein EP298_00570 [Gammaproteobacteria bacterium]UTW41887.1 hypothetical protein KFE69_10285 [bacterium SCSIO 12844]